MARRPTTTRITRRDAVVLLGAGAVAGATRTVPVRAQQPKPPKECQDEADVRRYGQPTRRYLVADTCCEESRTAILLAVEEQNHKPTINGKKHFKALRQALVEEKLAEYCVMVWGLDMEQVKTLRQQIPFQLKFGEQTPK